MAGESLQLSHRSAFYPFNHSYRDPFNHSYRITSYFYDSKNIFQSEPLFALPPQVDKSSPAAALAVIEVAGLECRNWLEMKYFTD